MLIKNTSDARKETISDSAAWDLISEAEEVLVGKGKKVISFTPKDSNKEEILKAALGRTGNLRAPAVKKGGTLFIGYNENIYEQL